VTYRTETKHVWKDDHEFMLLAPDGSKVASFHANVSAVWGINEMLQELCRRENIPLQLGENPEAEPLAEDP